MNVASAFSCCGALAVSDPWLANQRALEPIGLTQSEVVNSGIQQLLRHFGVSALVQVDRLCCLGVKNDFRIGSEPGPWSDIVSLWDGKFTEGDLQFQNVSEGDTALSMFAFIDEYAITEDSSQHPYKVTKQ